jgi:hypothetical protein
VRRGRCGERVYCVYTYVNGKMRSVETIPGMRAGRIKRMMEVVNSSMIYCKNFCKCHNVPQHSNKKIKE